jgi:redox-sensitive bicupin YhaK (pirin superfamily)
MIEVREHGTLGYHKRDWLESRFHFSFAEYHDPARMGFGPLRVWNDDIIQPGTGFPMHPHRDMEIITYVRRGAISHEDSLGNRGRTEAGDVQVMSAGTGIVHSEYNRETEGETTLFQIWIEPHTMDLPPVWQAREFPKEFRDGELTVLASGRAGDAGALPIHQDAALLGATLRPGDEVVHRLGTGRRAYLVSALGAIRVNGIDVAELDGVAVWDEEGITIEARETSEIMLFDLP